MRAITSGRRQRESCSLSRRIESEIRARFHIDSSHVPFCRSPVFLTTGRLSSTVTVTHLARVPSYTRTCGRVAAAAGCTTTGPIMHRASIRHEAEESGAATSARSERATKKVGNSRLPCTCRCGSHSWS